MSKVVDYVPEADDDDGAPQAKTAGWRYHSEAPPEPTAWLVKNLLPETGCGLIAGAGGLTSPQSRSTSPSPS